MKKYKRIQAVGRVLSPTYKPGVNKVQNTIKSFNDASAASLARINAKYNKQSPLKMVRTVDSKLQIHSRII